MTEAESGRTLLVAIDGSEPSLRALRHAIERAREVPGTVLVIAVAHEAAYEDARTLGHQTAGRLAADLDRHAQDLLQPALALARGSGIPFRSEILTGPAANALADCAEAFGAAGIVMGTRGMNAIGNLVLGSVATRVIHLSKVPVTLVK